jgi:hypothetical protein
MRTLLLVRKWILFHNTIVSLCLFKKCAALYFARLRGHTVRTLFIKHNDAREDYALGFQLGGHI